MLPPMAFPFEPCAVDRDGDVLPSGDMLFGGVPFTTNDARETALSRKVLRRLVDHGTIRRLLKGVYVDAGQYDSTSIRAAAAAKVIPPGSVICDRTAAWLHGADILGPDGRHRIPPLEVFRLAGLSRVRRPECVGGTRTLESGDVMEIEGVLVTTPLRTALDLGRLIGRHEAIGAIDALIRVGGFAIADLTAELPRFRGARGVVQLRALVPLADGRAESPAESLSRLRLRDAGLPAPQVQWEIRDALGIVIYRLDLAYPELKLAIEYDGEQFHTSAEDRAKDERRRAHVRRLGWTFVILRSKDVYGADAQAGRLVADKRRELTARAA